jgi:hypothetical protein
LRAYALPTTSDAVSFSFRLAPDTTQSIRKKKLRFACIGNPNVLTRDIGTSALSQGCTGQLTTVEVERFDGNLPPIQAYDPPVSSTSADTINR